MQNIIIEIIRKEQYGRDHQTLGFCKSDEEFNSMAADIILGADAPQYELLADALAQFSKQLADDELVDDPAYAEAAKHFAAAAAALHNRLGN